MNKLKNKLHFLPKLCTIAILVLVSIISILLISPHDAHADNPSTALILSPMSQKIVLTPGETYEGNIEVLNGVSANESLAFQASIGTYYPSSRENGIDDYDTFDVINRTEYNAMVDWTSLNKTTGTLAPNEGTTLTYTIKVPKDAPAGAQYISILVSSVDDDIASGTNIKSKYQLASVVFANVAGETIEKGSITENSMPSVLTNSKLEATSMVRNEGNIYTDATYTLQVWPMFSDEEICTNEESSETSLILPETERYHVQTCDLPAAGIFRAKQVVSIFGEQSVLEKTIIVCPIWLMIVILIIIIAIIGTIIYIVRKHKKGDEE